MMRRRLFVRFHLNKIDINASLRQWEADFQLSQAELGLQQEAKLWDRGQEEKEQLAETGWTLLNTGILPNALQLKAMELTEDQARSYLEGLKGEAVSGSASKENPRRTDSLLNKIRKNIAVQSVPKQQTKQSPGASTAYSPIGKYTDMLY